MPIVTIQITREGTTPEQKAALIKGATDLLVDVLNKPPALTFVVIQEVEMEDWGVGGLPAAEYRRQSTAGSPRTAGNARLHLAPEAGDQFGRGQRAGERGALPGPLGPVPELPGRLRGGVQRLSRVVGDRVVRDRSPFDAPAEGREAVGEAAGGAARDRGRHHGVLRRRAEERGPVARVGRRLRAGDEGRAELCGRRAERRAPRRSRPRP